MDSPSDLIELKRQLFDYFELSQKNINQKINLITNELDSLKKENEMICSKCKLIFEKLETYSESLNGTILSDVSQLSSIQKKEIYSINKKNKSSKINIHNLVINKKVQIAKQFSKTKINSLSNCPSEKHNSTFNTIQASSKEKSPIIGKKTPTKYRIHSKNRNSHSFLNASQLTTNSNSLHNKMLMNTKLQKGLKIKKNNSINDIRKLSIIDIPSINTLINTTECISDTSKKKPIKKNSLFDYLYQKDQKLYLILAQSSVLPIRLRKIFAKPIQFIYSNKDLLRDANTLYETKEKELSILHKDYIPFTLSLTSQFMLNFISKEQINKYLQEHSQLTDSTKDILIRNLFTILYIVCKESMHSNLVCDLINSAISKYNSFKSFLVNKLSNKVSVNRIQLETIHKILESNQDIISDKSLKVFENDNITLAIIVIIKDIYEYSQLELSNNIPMICYIYYLEQLHNFKEDINTIL